MLNKNKKYSFKELKEIFNEARNNVIFNQFKDSKDDKEEMNATAKYAMVLSGTLILHELESTLFGKDDD